MSAMMKPTRTAQIGLLAAAIQTMNALAAAPAGQTPPEAPPRWLSQTGLFVAGSPETIAPDLLPFAPQYPLWSDGATKRRWIRLPPGSAIDARRPDAWQFPVGTRLWKEFSLGRRIETRMIERLDDGSWRYLVYVWKEDGSDAELAPAEGIAALPVGGAPGGRYAIPSQADCRACHEGTPVPVLGFSALQLSPDRDPLAPHAEPPTEDMVDLRGLIARGLLRNPPRRWIDQPPRIAARSPEERAALGYLHGNCGHCHGDPAESEAAVPVDLLLAQSAARRDSAQAVRRSLTNHAARFRASGADAAPPAEVLLARMRSRDPRVQMPPLGTRVPDSLSLSLIERWLSHDLTATQEPQS